MIPMIDLKLGELIALPAYTVIIVLQIWANHIIVFYWMLMWVKNKKELLFMNVLKQKTKKEKLLQ